tara:strand:- start:111 stop:926 length:816 start_codon:yes stop_codon:yes gene_type:complete
MAMSAFATPHSQPQSPRKATPEARVTTANGGSAGKQAALMRAKSDEKGKQVMKPLPASEPKRKEKQNKKKGITKNGIATATVSKVVKEVPQQSNQNGALPIDATHRPSAKQIPKGKNQSLVASDDKVSQQKEKYTKEQGKSGGREEVEDCRGWTMQKPPQNMKQLEDFLAACHADKRVKFVVTLDPGQKMYKVISIRIVIPSTSTRIDVPCSCKGSKVRQGALQAGAVALFKYMMIKCQLADGVGVAQSRVKVSDVGRDKRKKILEKAKAM